MIILVIFHTIAIGLGDATTVRVCNFLGANMPEKAKFTAYVSISISFVVGMTCGAIIYFFDGFLAKIMSE